MSININIGNYTGKGSAPVISGCSFQPEATIIWGRRSRICGKCNSYANGTYFITLTHQSSSSSSVRFLKQD